jgi:hypothetical protein
VGCVGLYRNPFHHQVLVAVMVLIIVLALALLEAADVVAYDMAAYPERTYDWRYKLPGGGFVALWRLGRK